ncbi:MAG: hypothetical protein WBX35_06400, partial [Pseudolabrys sp.]
PSAHPGIRRFVPAGPKGASMDVPSRPQIAAIVNGLARPALAKAPDWRSSPHTAKQIQVQNGR